MSLRIIGGQCRGRRLKTPTGRGVRPTADRVRETLFNWLAPRLPGARVLDLFAGSGALGLEALSRGAREAVLVERDRRHLAVLQENVGLCALPGAVVKAMDALAYLKGPATSFDIVFLDPPYGQNWIPRVAALLEQGGWLAPEAMIYVELEAERTAELPQLVPPTWRLIRAKRSGGIGYNLCERQQVG
ncbi:MAG: 16S rRNA (guanine(966)-N(2))-methyltransferase RsmD [Pseudomonadota bacterium]|uniref:16S rRNA (guanine(966)-N(2))-methyltransferase RsmD n=1 Tax=Thermithiobacillus tepidarius TaxID=929 RepID=UPI00040F398F|nr:16S rRNA (guanine(966)-N(2))-methyltransferase RsmD [Thermithiobacillus tepidarius]